MGKQDGRIIRNTFYAQLAAFIVSSLTTSVGSMVDGVIIGQYLGVDSMAAFGVVTPLLIVFALAGTMVSSGARNRFTRFIGEGKLDEARGVFSMSCVLSVGFATALMIVMLVFASPIATFLGATGNAASLLPKARDYLIGIAIGLPAMNAVKILSGYMPLDNDRNLPVISSMGAGNKTRPEAVRVADLSETMGCPVARLLRKTLKKHGIEHGITCVFSPEEPVLLQGQPAPDGSGERRPLGSLITITALFALRAAHALLETVLHTDALPRKGMSKS